MALSVMSAFARRNVDPWQEAVRLSQLPRDVATRELCAMIAELPSGSPSRASPRAIAERLMAPLPRCAGSAASPRKTLSGSAVATRRETVIRAVALLLLLVSMVVATLGLQSTFVASTRAPTLDAAESAK